MNLPSKAVLDFSFLLFASSAPPFSYLAFPFPNIQAASPQRGLPHCRLKYWKVLSKFQAVISQLSNVLEVFSWSFKLKLNSDSSDEQEMILNQNLGVLVPKYIGTTNFAFHFLDQIQRADWGAIVFGSWVDIISNCHPRLPKTWPCNTSSATLRGHRKSRIQANSKIFAPKCFEQQVDLIKRKQFWGLGAL